MTSKPNFFIVGAPKCGTTALAQYLSEHPDVFVSNPKEPLYFMHPDADGRKILDEKCYLHLFKKGKNAKALGEASVWYLYSNHARQALKKFNPDAKIIIMRRNPVDFVASLHSQLAFSGDEKYDKLEKAWRENKDRVFHKQQDTIEKIPHWKTMYAELMNHEKYINKYQRDFGKNNVLILSQEELAKNTKECYRKTLVFIGVNDDGRNEFPKVNSNKEHKSQMIRYILHSVGKQKQILYHVSKLKSVLNIDTLGLYRFVKDKNIINIQRPAIADNLKDEILSYSVIPPEK